MCGRFLALSSGVTLAEHFGLGHPPPVTPRHNVAPSQPVLTVGLSKEGRPSTALFRWGLVPPWAADPKPGPINARAETAADKPTFADAFRKRRCLIPADGFYEWERLPGGKKRPWAFRLRGGGPFAFAGLWEAWRPPGGG